MYFGGDNVTVTKIEKNKSYIVKLILPLLKLNCISFIEFI